MILTKQLIIKAQSLKDFLSLFDNTMYLEELLLGDTWHPSNGYVDETILGGQHRIDEIIKFPYDFIGLVFLECKIDGLIIKLKTKHYDLYHTFEINGIDYKLRSLTNKIIEFNAEIHNKYEFDYSEF